MVKKKIPSLIHIKSILITAGFFAVKISFRYPIWIQFLGTMSAKLYHRLVRLQRSELLTNLRKIHVWSDIFAQLKRGYQHFFLFVRVLYCSSCF